jgi:hypothetical protein
MAAIAKVGTPSESTQNPPDAWNQPSYTAGEEIAAFDACYIDRVTGKIFRAIDSGAAALSARVHGYAWKKFLVNEPGCTLLLFCKANYGAGSPGDPVYLSAATPGGLDTAPSNGHGAIGYWLDAQNIILWPRVDLGAYAAPA